MRRFLLISVRGPLAHDRIGSRLGGFAFVALATVGTALGGVVAWLFVGMLRAAQRPFERVLALLGASLLYAFVAIAIAPAIALAFGRVPLPCDGEGPLRPRSLVFCASMRNYVAAELREEALAIAADVHRGGDIVHYLDGAFPVPLPIIPHLSHRDGGRLDLALAFDQGTGSPIGYFGYAQSRGERACRDRLLDLRWDFDMMQPLFGPPRLDTQRTRRLVGAVLRRERIGKLLLEPHITGAIALHSSRIRFQGCHAARHDDHMHIELAR